MTHLNDLQPKRKTKEDQGEEFGEQKTSIVHCHNDRPNDDCNYARGLEGRNKL